VKAIPQRPKETNYSNREEANAIRRAICQILIEVKHRRWQDEKGKMDLLGKRTLLLPTKLDENHEEIHLEQTRSAVSQNLEQPRGNPAI